MAHRRWKTTNTLEHIACLSFRNNDTAEAITANTHERKKKNERNNSANTENELLLFIRQFSNEICRFNLDVYQLMLFYRYHEYKKLQKKKNQISSPVDDEETREDNNNKSERYYTSTPRFHLVARTMTMRKKGKNIFIEQKWWEKVDKLLSELHSKIPTEKWRSQCKRKTLSPKT